MAIVADSKTLPASGTNNDDGHAVLITMILRIKWYVSIQSMKLEQQ